MRTRHQPELKAPVLAIAERLQGGESKIPLADLAALFGAEGATLDRVRERGDLVLSDGRFSNDGPDLTVPAGGVEIEIPNLVRGNYESGPGRFTLSFPDSDFTLKACLKLAFLRHCFDLKALRATPSDLTLDFGGGPADTRLTF